MCHANMKMCFFEKYKIDYKRRIEASEGYVAFDIANKIRTIEMEKKSFLYFHLVF